MVQRRIGDAWTGTTSIQDKRRKHWYSGVTGLGTQRDKVAIIEPGLGED